MFPPPKSKTDLKIVLLFTSFYLFVAASLIAQSAPSDATDTTVIQTYTTRCYGTNKQRYQGTIPISITCTAVPLNNTDGAPQYEVTVAIKNIQSSTCFNWMISIEPTADTFVSLDNSVSGSKYFNPLYFIQGNVDTNIDPDDTFSFTYVIALSQGVPKPTLPDWIDFTWYSDLNSTENGVTIYGDYRLAKVIANTETR